MRFNWQSELKEQQSQNATVLFIGNSMMHGQLFHGLQLTTMADGSHFNILQREHIQTLLFLLKTKDKLLLLTTIFIQSML
jgi:hypothetical protein